MDVIAKFYNMAGIQNYMNLFLYSAIAFVSFLGLAGGMFLAYSNRDELKPGRRYLVFAQKAIWALIIILTALAYQLPLYAVIIILIFTVLPFFDRKQVHAPSMYLLQGIIFYLSAESVNLLAANASLIFLFGLPSGTLIKADENGKIRKGFVKGLAKNLGFFVCMPLFFFI
jgi:hypothetical protein